jgi:dTMP kinase
MSVKRGCIVCIEGIDGSGKDTQIHLLTHYLEADGLTVEKFNFPDYEGPLGSCIRSALIDPNFNPYALQLLFSAERLRQMPFLEQVVTDGRIAVTNRYRWSSYVYSIARGLPREWAENLETPLPETDITLLLDLEAEESIRRTGGSDVIERDFEVLERCRQEYLKLAKTQKNWKVVDAHQEQSIIADILKAEVLNIVNRHHELP